MKKSSKTLLLVGGLLSILVVIIAFILAYSYGAVAKADIQTIKQAIDNGNIALPAGYTAKQYAEQLQKMAKFLYPVCLFIGFARVAAIFVALFCRSSEFKKAKIACIVVGVISDSPLIIIGGILGTIVASNEQSKLEELVRSKEKEKDDIY